MKIIYVGGYSDINRKKSHFYEYCQPVKHLMDKGRNVVFVNFAQTPGYFNQRLIELYDILPNIIDTNRKEKVDWGVYDLLYISGGNTKDLKQSLVKYGFDLNKLKESVIVICDSAGANVMSKYYLGKSIGNGGSLEYVLTEGLNPASNLLTVCHVDNPQKAPLGKIERAKVESVKTGARLLLLKENESRMTVDNGDIKGFAVAEIYN